MLLYVETAEACSIVGWRRQAPTEAEFSGTLDISSAHYRYKVNSPLLPGFRNVARLGLRRSSGHALRPHIREWLGAGFEGFKDVQKVNNNFLA